MTGFHMPKNVLGRLRPKREIASKDADNSSCPLLNLPPELRNVIWEMALSEDKDIALPCPTPALLQTCQQMRNEGRAMWLSGQTVVIKPGMQEVIRKGSPAHGKPGWRERFVGQRTAYDDLKAFLKWQEPQGLLSRVGVVRITIGSVSAPHPFAHDLSAEARSVLLKHMGHPYMEIVLDFQQANPFPPLDPADGCLTCGSLRIFQDMFQTANAITTDMGDGRGFAARTPTLKTSGIHAEIPGCTIHVVFGNSYCSFGSRNVRDTMHWTWLHQAMPHLEQFLAGSRASASGWMSLVKALEELLGCGENDVLLKGLVVFPKEMAGDEMLKNVKWRSVCASEGWW
ncbi:hypothetical protein LTR85_001394 [Meristemomyces frigidus]|nr:hypothetical protein LTR85_001394 [Meristemomyces frigidus]